MDRKFIAVLKFLDDVFLRRGERGGENKKRRCFLKNVEYLEQLPYFIDYVIA